MTVRVLSANVGNLLPWCVGYEFNCCLWSVERRIAAALRARDPDIVFLQEVTPYALAADRREWCPRRVGYRSDNRAVPDQVRRLLGPEYTIVCDPHRGTESIAIRRGVGEFLPDDAGRSIEAGELGGLHHSGGPDTTRYQADFVASSDDDGFVMVSADAVVDGQEIRLVCAHPQALTNDRARADQVATAFERWGDHPRVLLAGDWNIDPFRQDDRAVDVWHRYVDRYGPRGRLVESGRFRYHSGVVEDGHTWPPRPTAHPPWPIGDLTLDHVVSTFATGSVRTLQGAANLDGGRGMDHDALCGALELS